jgi:hypothetical protein
MPGLIADFTVRLEGGGTTTATAYAATTASAEDTARALLILAHGAGAGHRHPYMTAFARGLATSGIDVVTFNFPYIEQKRRVPDRAPALEACFRSVIAASIAHARFASAPLFLGGKSMGGRMATHLAAQGVERLRGLVLLGYPLHPPGKPDQQRRAHLPAITAPVLIVQGERDAFGTPAELAPVIETMAAPVTLHPVVGGDHSLAVRGQKPAEMYAPLFALISAWILRYV